MEKLIELLTEHCRKHYGFKDNDDIEIDTDSVCFHLYHKGKRCFPIRIETVICKDFGFIKWLVENDKINTSKANDKNLNGYEIELRIRAVKELVADSEEKTVLYLNLLMLLSISDTPIDDLCGYLKDDNEELRIEREFQKGNTIFPM